jgi:hypothetical protein
MLFPLVNAAMIAWPPKKNSPPEEFKRKPQSDLPFEEIVLKSKGIDN